jgi:hypothetical protein
MSYYQIIEYHMESCFSEELANQVKAACGAALVLGAGRELSDLIAEASSLLGVPLKNLKFTELKATKAVISQRIDPSLLARDLAVHKEGALEYFLSRSVDFVETKPVMLKNVSKKDGLLTLTPRNGAVVTGVDAHRTLCDQIASRVYDIRCAITHSKISRRRYSPYRDDLQLAREVPLVRLAAEQIIFQRADWL